MKLFGDNIWLMQENLQQQISFFANFFIFTKALVFYIYCFIINKLYIKYTFVHNIYYTNIIMS